MNWYKTIIKLSQIWETTSDGSFKDELESLYELEYKLSMMKSRPFSGHEKRKQKTIEALEDQLEETVDTVKEPLEHTLSGWLSEHNLTDPSQWGEARADNFEDLNPSEALESALSEYLKYAYGSGAMNAYVQQQSLSRAFNDLVSNIENNLDSYPSLKPFIDVLTQDKRMAMEDELRSFDLEEFNDQYETSFENKDEAVEYIQSMEADSSDLEVFFSVGMDELVSSIEPHINMNQFIKEIFQNLVFPQWYGHWSDRGIEKTKENIENIYQQLTNAKTLNNKISAVNLALNAVHHGGDMLEHMDFYAGIDEPIDKEKLNELSNANVEEWNQELREIGLQV